MTFSVEIPVPPSVNNAYGNGKKGRYKKPASVAWSNEAVQEIWRQVPAGHRIGGKVIVYIALPEKMAGDCDNRIKPILDALVASQRIDDDRNVHAVTASKTHDKATALVRVARYMPADGRVTGAAA